ncbi:MAG: hypothetical protein U0Y82_02470 [Thermoleophilia bacterium]
MASATLWSAQIKGEQTTTWSYAGRAALGSSSCDAGSGDIVVPSQGSGKQTITFRSRKAGQLLAMRSPKVYVSGDISVPSTLDAQGSLVEHWSQATLEPAVCQYTPDRPDTPSDASGCGTMPQVMSMTLRAGARGLVVRGTSFANPSRQSQTAQARLQRCPLFATSWLDVPATQLFRDDTGRVNDYSGNSYDVAGGGTLSTVVRPLPKALYGSAHRLVITGRRTRGYRHVGAVNDPTGVLQGSTTVRWTLTLTRIGS